MSFVRRSVRVNTTGMGQATRCHVGIGLSAMTVDRSSQSGPSPALEDVNVTTRHQRRSTKPLSFYGIKFKMSAAMVPAKPASESIKHAATHPPDKVADLEATETVGQSALDADPIGQAISARRSLDTASPGGLRTNGAAALRGVLHGLAHLAEVLASKLVLNKRRGLPFLRAPKRQ